MAEAVSFWSYSHADNESARGALLDLAGAIRNEYDLQTGSELQLFLDRDDLRWGDTWRKRVDAGLTQATFFIAAITPRYFTRAECRREFTLFLAQAKSLGVEEYLLPILFVEVPDLTEDNPEELKAIVARTQFADWTRLRLRNPSDEEYRKAVRALVVRLRELEARLLERKLTAQSLGAELERIEPIDFVGLVEQVQKLLPAWHDSVLTSQTKLAQIQATYDTFNRRRNKFTRRNAPRSAHLSALVGLAEELEPMLDNYLELARKYSRQCIELDPLVVRLIREVGENPDFLELLNPVSQAIDDAYENILDREKNKAQADAGDTVVDFFRENSRFIRKYQKLVQASVEMLKLIDEGNGIVMRWRSSLVSLLDQLRPVVVSERGDEEGAGSTAPT